MFDNFHDLAGIGLLVELQDEIFSFDRITLVVELDGTGDAFEAFNFSHRDGDIGAAGFLAWIGLEPLFHRLDTDQRCVVAV